MAGESTEDVQAKKTVDFAYITALRNMMDRRTGERLFAEDEIFDKFRGDSSFFDSVQLFYDLGNAIEDIDRELPRLNDMLLETAEAERKSWIPTDSDENVIRYRNAKQRKD